MADSNMNTASMAQVEGLNTSKVLEMDPVIQPYVKDALTRLLENRPADPIAYLAEYFRAVTKGSSSIFRAYGYIRDSPRKWDLMMDNLVAAYTVMDTRRTTTKPAGLRMGDLTSLIKLVCCDFPYDIVPSLIKKIGKKSDDLVEFNEFVETMKACLMYEEFFEKLEKLFNAFDKNGRGLVPAHSCLVVLDRIKQRPELQAKISGEDKIEITLPDDARDDAASLMYFRDFVRFVVTAVKLN